jgi:murein DD-endopeptidase MepM/ murein hydrolase activator NlpD
MLKPLIRWIVALVAFGVSNSLWAFENPVVPGSTYGPLRFGSQTTIEGATWTHAGVDLLAPCATAVKALMDGTVVDVINSTSDRDFTKRDVNGNPIANTRLGYMVMLKHNTALVSRTFYTLYLHLQEPPSVGIGERVAGGTMIGKVGKTGAANNVCHTHLEIRFFLATGPGTRYLPAWQNIYGPGDQSASDQLLGNFGNPEVYDLIVSRRPKAPELLNPQGVASNAHVATFQWTTKNTEWYRFVLWRLDGNSWVSEWDEWLSSATCNGTQCATTLPIRLDVTRHGWWLQPYSASTGGMAWLNGDFQVESTLDAAQRAILDAAKQAKTDGRFEPMFIDRVGMLADTDPSWQWRWMDYGFAGARMTTIWHLTLKSDPTIRYTQFFDPDRGAWTGWIAVP